MVFVLPEPELKRNGAADEFGRNRVCAWCNPGIVLENIKLTLRVAGPDSPVFNALVLALALAPNGYRIQIIMIMSGTHRAPGRINHASEEIHSLPKRRCFVCPFEVEGTANFGRDATGNAVIIQFRRAPEPI